MGIYRDAKDRLVHESVTPDGLILRLTTAEKISNDTPDNAIVFIETWHDGDQLMRRRTMTKTRRVIEDWADDDFGWRYQAQTPADQFLLS